MLIILNFPQILNWNVPFQSGNNLTLQFALSISSKDVAKNNVFVPLKSDREALNLNGQFNVASVSYVRLIILLYCEA